jgi:hypothetical protein
MRRDAIDAGQTAYNAVVITGLLSNRQWLERLRAVVKRIRRTR